MRKVRQRNSYSKNLSRNTGVLLGPQMTQLADGLPRCGSGTLQLFLHECLRQPVVFKKPEDASHNPGQNEG